MDEKTKREKLHRILDLVLDLNGFEERKGENGPAVFMNFSGHTCQLDVHVCESGWKSSGIEYDYSQYCYIDEEAGDLYVERLEETIAYLEGLKNGTDSKL